MFKKKLIVISIVILGFAVFIMYGNLNKKAQPLEHNNISTPSSNSFFNDPKSPGEGVLLELPKGWKQSGSIIENQTGNKTGELAPGLVTPKNGETCNDYIQKIIKGGNDILTEEVNLSFSSGVNKEDIKEGPVLTTIQGKMWYKLVHKQILDGPSVDGHQYWYVYNYCTQDEKKIFFDKFL